MDIAIRGPTLSMQSAPAEIDYLSIEHNFTPARERIRALLERQGYVRKREHLSRFEDWYVHRDLCDRPSGARHDIRRM